MTEKKRKRGRPKLPTPITEDYASSRRQAVNAMYMYEAVDLIKAAAAEIPNGDALWFADDRTRTAASKNGVLEQIGRMRVQDGFSDGLHLYRQPCRRCGERRIYLKGGGAHDPRNPSCLQSKGRSYGRPVLRRPCRPRRGCAAGNGGLRNERSCE